VTDESALSKRPELRKSSSAGEERMVDPSPGSFYFDRVTLRREYVRPQDCVPVCPKSELRCLDWIARERAKMRARPTLAELIGRAVMLPDPEARRVALRRLADGEYPSVDRQETQRAATRRRGRPRKLTRPPRGRTRKDLIGYLRRLGPDESWEECRKLLASQVGLEVTTPELRRRYKKLATIADILIERWDGDRTVGRGAFNAERAQELKELLQRVRTRRDNRRIRGARSVI
jgi:hypothetical protein